MSCLDTKSNKNDGGIRHEEKLSCYRALVHDVQEQPGHELEQGLLSWMANRRRSLPAKNIGGDQALEITEA